MGWSNVGEEVVAIHGSSELGRTKSHKHEENFSSLLDLFPIKKAGDGVWAYEDVYFFYKERNREGLVTQSM